MEDNKQVSNAVDYACPSCGGVMVFDVNTQSLTCAYCDNVVNIESEKVDIIENDFSDFVEDDYIDPKWNQSQHVIHCDSCGGETILSTNEISTLCAFCGSSHVVDVKTLPGIKPHYIIPFAFDSKRAVELFGNWTKRKWFVPNQFKKLKNIDAFNPIYLPYWSFDSSISSDYSALRGDYYYVTRTRTVRINGKSVTQTYQERKVKWTPVSGMYDHFFDDIIINAGNIETIWKRSYLKQIWPFPLKQMNQFNPKFLAGYKTQRYSVNLKDGWERARMFINEQMPLLLKKEIGGDEVSKLRYSINYMDIKFKHFLLPIWLCTYKYGNKKYPIVINGCTGKIAGDYPLSYLKITILVIVIVILIGAGYIFAKFYL